MKRDIYAEVSARIVAELEAGAAPWVKPWSATPGANTPCNAVSNRPYSGCNVVLLWMAPIAVDRCLRLRKIYGPNGEVTTMGADPQIVDGVALMRAFLKLADAADRRKVIELAVALGRGSGTSPPIAPR